MPIQQPNYQLSDNDKLIISNIINKIIQEQTPIHYCPTGLERFCHTIIKYHRDSEDRDYNDDIEVEWSRLPQWAKDEIHKTIAHMMSNKKIIDEQRIQLLLQHIYDLKIRDEYNHTDTPYTDALMDDVINKLSYQLSRGLCPSENEVIKAHWDLYGTLAQQLISEELTKHYNICYEVVEI